MWVWEHALFNYNPKRPDSTKKDKTVEVITKADHDAALRRAKAEGWREAIVGVTNLKADMENGVPPSERMGFSRACNEIIGYANARAAQIDDGEST